MFPDRLDWWWRHMALIRRLFNLSLVTMPRVSRLNEFADGLSWYKMFIMQPQQLFLCVLPTLVDLSMQARVYGVCACV